MHISTQSLYKHAYYICLFVYLLVISYTFKESHNAVTNQTVIGICHCILKGDK